MEILEDDLIKVENILDEIITTSHQLKIYLECPLNEEKINYLVIIPHISTIKSLNSFLRIKLKDILGEYADIPQILFDLDFDLRVLLETETDINNVNDIDFIEHIIGIIRELISEHNKNDLIKELLEKAN